jgi:thiol-disulfide isomerase/thioredoxin
MCRSRKTVLHVPLVALALIAFTAFCIGGFKRGDRLPDLSSFKLEGKLPDKLQGQVILLDFWASWCAPCKASFPAMQDLQKAYKERGLTIVAVSEDTDRKNMDRFLKSAGVSFAVVRDAEQKLVEAADVQTMPTSFLIDRAGQIRFVHDGFHGEQTTRQYQSEIEQLLKNQDHENPR